MTTKQKIIASIWVPVVSVYLQMVAVSFLIFDRLYLGFINLLESVTATFIIGGISWIPTLLICLIIEYNWIKNDMEKIPIYKILLTEAMICLFTLWLPIIFIIQRPDVVIFSIVAILLSIAARWRYLKWRKIC